MAALAKLPVYLSVGDMDRFEIGTIELKVSTSAPTTDGGIDTTFAADLPGLADLLEAAAKHMRTLLAANPDEKLANIHPIPASN